MEKIKIVGISGSDRKGSYNTALLTYLSTQMLDNVDFKIIDITKLPFFHQDLETSNPEEVLKFRGELKEADAFVLATPEYNYSIPPLLKNALDWGSRGDGKEFEQKYVGIISASPSILGGARAQYQLRQICVCLNLLVLNRPEVFVSKAYEKIDQSGQIIDEGTKERLNELFQQLIVHVQTKKDIL